MIPLLPRIIAGRGWRTWLRPLGVEISFVGLDPVRRHIALRRCQLDLPLANQLMEVIFELVLYPGIQVDEDGCGQRFCILSTPPSAGVIR